MFKKILLLIAVLLPLSAFAQKIGVVDIQSVVSALPEWTEANKTLEASSNQLQAELTKLQEEVQKLYQEYQTIAEDPNTPQSIKERRMSEIQEKGAKVEQFRRQAENDLAQQSQQLMAPLQTKVMDAIKAVGQEGGYTLVLPQDDALLLYTGSDVTDVTPTVKTRLGL